MHLNYCKELRGKLLEKYLREPVAMQDHIETVLFHLALEINSNSIAPDAFFGHKIHYVESDVDRGLDANCLHLEVKHVAIKCWRESTEWLEKPIFGVTTLSRMQSALKRCCRFIRLNGDQLPKKWIDIRYCCKDTNRVYRPSLMSMLRNLVK
jgi:hypothetical protein